jgi:hypothetical protein
LVRPDPKVSRFFFAPTARTLPAGGPSAITPSSSRSSTTASPVVSPYPAGRLFIAPKVGLVHTPSLGLAVGALYGGAALASEGASGGVAFAAGTLESENRVFTASDGRFAVGGGFRIDHVLEADMGSWPFVPWVDFVVHW